MSVEQPTFWGAWHPRHGFEIPDFYQGPIVFVDLDSCARLVRDLNRDDRTNNRNGWRATKVKIERWRP